MYLDYAASTPVRPEVLQEFNRVAVEEYANPSSEHYAGVLAKEEINYSKEKISRQLGCSADELYFTSGATMSNNVVIQGFVQRKGLNAFMCSAVEHNDIMMIADYLHGSVKDHYMLGVDDNGIIKLDELDDKLRKYAELGFSVLVSIQVANSETGIIQPIAAISEIIHKYPNCYFHTDATQYIPYFQVNVKTLGIDALSMSGQKIGGLKGSGLLYLNNDLRITPIIIGEQGLIGGTYPTPLIVSLAKAFELNHSDNTDLYKKRDYLLDDLLGLGAEIIGTTDLNERLPNNVCVRFSGVRGDTLMHLLSEQGIYISTGSACSSGSDKPSHVALAMGLSEQQAMEMVRITIGNATTYEDLDYVAKAIKGLLELIR